MQNAELGSRILHSAFMSLHSSARLLTTAATSPSQSAHGLELALGSCEWHIIIISSSERSAAMKERRFSNGDRVKTCETIRDLPVGAYGVVKRVYVSMPGTYDVQFDHRPDIYTIWGGHLEPAAEESEAVIP
jgi:hypothetical protein